MAIATIYPSEDAYLTTSNANFSTLRSLASADSITDNTQLHIACDKPSAYEIKRDILVFDTSTLPNDAIISDVKFYFYNETSGNGEGNNELAVTGATPADPATIAVEDWDAMTINTPTEYATRIAFSSFSAGWNCFTFNASGKSAVSKTGNTIIAVREGKHDIDNSAPAGTGNYIIYTSGDAGSNKPYLEITYTTDTTVTISGATAILSLGSITTTFTKTISGAISIFSTGLLRTIVTGWQFKNKNTSTWTGKTKNNSSWTNKNKN